MSTTLIIGAGHAGSQCAVSLRSEGYDGEIALVNNDVETPYHKPPLSKKYLRAQEPEATALRAASTYAKADVRWIQASVETIDVTANSVRLSDQTTERYDHLVLATGARNRTLEELSPYSNVFSLRTLTDANVLHQAVASAKNVCVLGGGFIGLEVAACLAAMGKQVHVVEAAKRLLGRVVAPEISARVHSALVADGVRVTTNNSSSSFESANDKLTGLTLADNTVLEVDLMLVGIGAIPNCTVASDAGIECNNGVVVDDRLNVSDTNIYAIGDCAAFPHWQTATLQRLESVQNAVDQAKHVAKSIATNTLSTYRNVPWFWSDIGEQKLQIAGIYSGESQTVVREEANAFALYHLQDEQVVCVESLNSVKDHMLARKLIAAEVKVSQDTIACGIDALKDLLKK